MGSGLGLGLGFGHGLRMSLPAQGWAKNSFALEATTARLIIKLKSSAEADSMRAYCMASLTRCGEARLIWHGAG